MLEKLIEQTWQASQYYHQGITVKARVLLDDKNDILELNLLQPSGIVEVDKAVMALFKDLAPFNELQGLSIEEYGNTREMMFILD